MRLDARTLTTRSYQDLIAALLEIDALRTATGRRDVLERINSPWRHDIPYRDADRAHVMEIWDAAAGDDRRRELFAAIETVEPNSPALESVYRIVEQLTAFVEANDALYPHLDTFVAALSGAPRETVARWMNYVQSAAGVELDTGPAAGPTRPLRDALLTLGNYSARADGRSFPLFTVVEGIAADLDTPARAAVREALDSLATRRGVTIAGIARLRAEVEAARGRSGASGGDGAAPAHETSILVRIEPDGERQTPPYYFFRVYDWQPWERDDLVRDMGSSGRAVNPCDRMASLTPEMLLPRNMPSALGREIGNRLLRTASPQPLVEFLVPGALVSEPFEDIQVDPLGDLPPFYVALGTVARVVVRPLERWAPRFLADRQLPVSLWRSRWQRFAATPAGPLRAWMWRSSVAMNAVVGLLRTQALDVGCVGVGFAATPSRTREVYTVILAAGAPVAVWMRSGSEEAVEATLLRLINAAEPADLRDRVQAERVNAVVAGGEARAELTLLWDDPDRPPHTIDG